MTEERSDVIVADYRSVESADADLHALVAAVKAKTVRIEAATLASRDAAGSVAVGAGV